MTSGGAKGRGHVRREHGDKRGRHGKKVSHFLSLLSPLLSQKGEALALSLHGSSLPRRGDQKGAHLSHEPSFPKLQGLGKLRTLGGAFHLHAHTHSLSQECVYGSFIIFLMLGYGVLLLPSSHRGLDLAFSFLELLCASWDLELRSLAPYVVMVYLAAQGASHGENSMHPPI